MSEPRNHVLVDDRRWNERATKSLVVRVTSVWPHPYFSEDCTVINVSERGCRFLASRPFPHDTWFTITILSNRLAFSGRVVYSLPVRSERQKMAWKVGLRLDAPVHSWGAESPS